MSEQIATPGSKASPEASPKRERIIAAATRVFLELGYGAASMDAIAREAGVSKQTIYSHFGDKDALFGAIVQQRCEQLLTPILAPELYGDDPETALMAVAHRFLGVVLAAENAANLRVVIAESGRFPELAETFYRVGPKLAAERLAEYLDQMNRKGVLTVPDCEDSARLFFAMLRGDLYLKRLLGLGSEPTAEEIDRAAALAVDVFLSAHTRRRHTD